MAQRLESLSFQALHERIGLVAACLAAQGIGAGDVVAQFAENGLAGWRWIKARCGWGRQCRARQPSPSRRVGLHPW